jgi:hypothetical protein
MLDWASLFAGLSGMARKLRIQYAEAILGCSNAQASIGEI